ncbi:hypothetical protein [Nonomuraea aurantiaca]|uniref:hypothetical protein n=1 Tax=Nonomuraea aurantiaca TaxID=2878562 RepID=UPI001CDA2AF9|nr:hypothetical protein [Nonomuraea aurantiaca]MCA2228792.1 hypothetical protein [Nonomuraea aurantiaca]
MLAEELRRRLTRQDEAIGIQMLPISMRAEGRNPLPRTYGSLAAGDLTQALNLPIRGRPRSTP